MVHDHRGVAETRTRNPSGGSERLTACAREPPIKYYIAIYIWKYQAYWIYMWEICSRRKTCICFSAHRLFSERLQEIMVLKVKMNKLLILSVVPCIRNEMFMLAIMLTKQSLYRFGNIRTCENRVNLYWYTTIQILATLVKISPDSFKVFRIDRYILKSSFNFSLVSALRRKLRLHKMCLSLSLSHTLSLSLSLSHTLSLSLSLSHTLSLSLSLSLCVCVCVCMCMCVCQCRENFRFPIKISKSVTRFIRNFDYLYTKFQCSKAYIRGIICVWKFFPC